MAALDESEQEKDSAATTRVQRQYMGNAGRITNSVNTVYRSYATPGGHALVGARIYAPADQLDDPDRRAVRGIADEVTFGRSHSWPWTSCGTWPPTPLPGWCAGDEVYGRSGEVRSFCEDNRIGYVLRVGRAFHTDLAAGVRPRTDAVMDTLLSTQDSWQNRAALGWYAWA